MRIGQDSVQGKFEFCLQSTHAERRATTHSTDTKNLNTGSFDIAQLQTQHNSQLS